jgi:hypothetical protein
LPQRNQLNFLSELFLNRIQMLAPSEKKTHLAYVWAYGTTPFSALKAVVYDFSPTRADEQGTVTFSQKGAPQKGRRGYLVGL